jgi:hypothetical protein
LEAAIRNWKKKKSLAAAEAQRPAAARVVGGAKQMMAAAGKLRSWKRSFMMFHDTRKPNQRPRAPKRKLVF